MLRLRHSETNTNNLKYTLHFTNYNYAYQLLGFHGDTNITRDNFVIDIDITDTNHSLNFVDITHSFAH